jgi:hypothetical protein
MVDEPMPRRIKERFAELLPLGRTDVLGRYRDSGDRDERLIPFRARVLDIDFDLAREALRVTDLIWKSKLMALSIASAMRLSMAVRR